MRLTDVQDANTRRNLQRWAKRGLFPEVKREQSRGRAWIFPDDCEAQLERVKRLLQAGFTFEEVKRALAKLEERPEGVVIAKGIPPAPRSEARREIDVVRLRDIQNLVTDSGAGQYPVTFVSFARRVNRGKKE